MLVVKGLHFACEPCFANCNAPWKGKTVRVVPGLWLKEERKEICSSC